MDCCFWSFLFYVICSLSIVVFSFCILVILTSKPYAENVRSENEKYYTNEAGLKCCFPSVEDDFSVALSVIVPAYNEEKRLKPMLEECIAFLQSRSIASFSYEIIIVSDGSSDRTPQAGYSYTLKYGSDKVRVLVLNPNRGKGGAVQMGVTSCRGAVILFADADGATRFSDITKLEQSLERLTTINYLENAEECSRREAVICGSRAHLEEESIATRSAFRTFLMYGFHFLVKTFTVRSIRDTQCGFKMFTRTAARRLFSNLHVRKWAFDVEMLYLAERLGIPTEEVAVTWTEIEGSKIVPVLSWLQMGKDLVMIWLRYRLGAWKIKEKVQ